VRPENVTRTQLVNRMSANPTLTNPPVPALASDLTLAPPPSRLTEGIADLTAGMSRSWIWTRLAYQDIKERYRGSVLGPFWVTLTNLVMIVTMGVIYARLFKVEPGSYVPYIMTGLLTWQFISGIISESCFTFTSAQHVIQQVPMPFSVQAYRVVYRNLIVFAHNAVIIPFGLLLFEVPVRWNIIEIVPAIAVLSFNGWWTALLLGTISTRFRDIPPIVTNVVQVLFFLTPIFWPLSSAGDLKDLLRFNPLFAAIDVVRAPLLGLAPEPTSWPILLGCSVFGGLLSFLFFVRFRERIAYWI
jgi:ABC-type polysaccharide/polyol phosphate export permease